MFTKGDFCFPYIPIYLLPSIIQVEVSLYKIVSIFSYTILCIGFANVLVLSIYLYIEIYLYTVQFFNRMGYLFRHKCATVNAAGCGFDSFFVSLLW